MDLNKISEEAERERQRDANRKKSKPRKKGKGFHSHEADGWFVYNRIYPDSFNALVWIMGCCVLGFIGLLLYWMKMAEIWAFYAGLVFFGLFAIRYSIHWLIKISKFGAYKNWRTRLGFTVHGWDGLGSVPNFPRVQYWQLEARLAVSLKPNASLEVQQLVRDALFLFTKKANSWFYEADQALAGFGSDPREKWILESPSSAVGSADCGVAGEMYRTISTHLKSIHAQHSAIESVTVNWGKRLARIKPPEIRD